MPRLSYTPDPEFDGPVYLVSGIVTHSQLQTAIIEACRQNMLHVHHCDMRQSQAGFPDLVIIGRGGVLWRELKVPPDVPNSAQRALGYRLIAARQNYNIWTPADWESGVITEELESIVT